MAKLQPIAGAGERHSAHSVNCGGFIGAAYAGLRKLCTPEMKDAELEQTVFKTMLQIQDRMQRLHDANSEHPDRTE